MPGTAAAAMMRIAIVGGGGFANILVRELSESAHALIVLSTQEHPEFDEFDCQVAVVDYNNIENLRFILQGVDLVISTICNTSQINLIDAARRARVRCFVPSEFEGALSRRPSDNDPLDRGSSTAALDYLRRWSTSRSHPMKFTVFSCGLFYERLAPGGLAAYNMGYSSGVQEEGDYMVNLRNGTAVIPEVNAQGRSVRITMTSVYDVARFVAAAVELGLDSWPREFKMLGASLSTKHLVEVCEEVRGDKVTFHKVTRPYNELLSWLQYYEEHQDERQYNHMQQLVQTANGRFHFSDPNLNEMVPIQPVGLRPWLQEIWGSGV
ncbi:isoflavone reductase family protein [Apiospora phragmitis]|uniref:Isoflavone reductase family protein n=1 Tax=Apiospora phragmitis TaxID=2905665 RepID=A0ABR1TXP4_9PEZI